MFTCPKCNADRSRVLPVDPCPECGAMLAPQGAAGPIVEEISQDEIPTIAVDGPAPLPAPPVIRTPAPELATVASSPAAQANAASGKSRSDTQSDTVEFDPGATLAQTKPKKKPETQAPPQRTKGKPSLPPPTPSAARAKAPGAPSASGAPKLSTASQPGSISGSINIPEAVAKQASERAKGPAAARTDVELIEEIEPIVESTEVGAELSEVDVGDHTDPHIPTPVPEPNPASLPPLPKAAASVDSAAAPAGPAASPFDATDSVGDVLTKTVAHDSGPPPPVFTAPLAPAPAPAFAAPLAPVLGAPVSEAPITPSPMPDVYTRTVADAEAVAIPGPPAVAGVAPMAPAAMPGRLPSAVTSSSNMPSAMIPRPPRSAVVSPTPVPVAAVLGSLSAAQPPVVDPSAVSMPGDYALPQAPNASPGGPLAAPPAYHAPPLAAAAPGYAPPPMVHTPPPMVHTPPPMVHTPPPPMLIGPPPDATDGSYPGAALDALAGENAPMMGPPNGGRPDSSNAVWRQAHPSAQRWAAKRNTGAPRAPRAGVIALGLFLAGFGVYLLALFLPSKAPLTAAEHALMAQQAGVDEGAWRFSEELMAVANLNAGLFLLLGVVVVLRGALHREAPGQARRKKMDKTSVMLLACFGLFAMSFLALVLSASVG